MLQSPDKTCDSHLDELKEGLEEICWVSVSMPTVIILYNRYSEMHVEYETNRNILHQVTLPVKEFYTTRV